MRPAGRMQEVPDAEPAAAAGTPPIQGSPEGDQEKADKKVPVPVQYQHQENGAKQDHEALTDGASQDNPYLVPPPLPLLNTSPRSDPNSQAFTGADEDLQAIDFQETWLRPASKREKPSAGASGDGVRSNEALYHPWLSHRLASYMAAREAICSSSGTADVGGGPRGAERRTLVYTRHDPHEVPVEGTSKGGGASPRPLLPSPPPPPDNETDSLTFDSAFESGNLKMAMRVFDRAYETTPTPAHVSWRSQQASVGDNEQQPLPSVVLPAAVHQEYDLLCKPDTYTKGHIQWYFFSVQLPPDAPAGLRVRFNLINMMKRSSLYSFGMRPCVYSTKALQEEGCGWVHRGEDITYFKNTRTYMVRRRGGRRHHHNNNSNNHNDTKGTEKARHYYTLSFVYEFPYPGDRVYFAHSYPYSYTNLQQDLGALEEDRAIRAFCKRRELCRTIAGNRCELLTITSHTDDPEVLRRRPAVVITARAHPGESNSSWMMKGVIDYLTSNTREAIVLRDHFVFKLVPMINPDGVINGNYRSSLAGCDLNRRYDDPSEVLHPTVMAVKHLLKTTKDHRPILLYIDLHGHSKKKNVFLYGCDASQQHARGDTTPPPTSSYSEERVFPRVVPRLLSNLYNANHHQHQEQHETGFFRYQDCNFDVQRSKASTGRVVAWGELGIPGAFTLEASFCGAGTNGEQKVYASLNRQATAKVNHARRQRQEAGAEEKGQEANMRGSEDNDQNGDDEDGFRTLRETMGSTTLPLRRQLTPPPPSDAHEGEGVDVPADMLPLINDFQLYSHFDRQDFMRIGHRLCDCILDYANLKRAALQKASYKYMAGYGAHDNGGDSGSSSSEDRDMDDDGDSDDDAGEGKTAKGESGESTTRLQQNNSDDLQGNEEEEDESGCRPLKKPPPVPVVCPSEYEAFLHPAVIEARVAERLSCTWERAKAETEIRRILSRKERCRGWSAQREGGQHEEEEEEGGGSAGSDSDPSADDLDPLALRKTKAWMAMASRVAARSESSFSTIAASLTADQGRRRRRPRKSKRNKGHKGGSRKAKKEEAEPATPMPAIAKKDVDRKPRVVVTREASSGEGDGSAKSTPYYLPGQTPSFMDPTLSRVNALRGVISAPNLSTNPQPVVMSPPSKQPRQQVYKLMPQLDQSQQWRKHGQAVDFLLLQFDDAFGQGRLGYSGRGADGLTSSYPRSPPPPLHSPWSLPHHRFAATDMRGELNQGYEEGGAAYVSQRSSPQRATAFPPTRTTPLSSTTGGSPRAQQAYEPSTSRTPLLPQRDSVAMVTPGKLQRGSSESSLRTYYQPQHPNPGRQLARGNSSVDPSPPHPFTTTTSSTPSTPPPMLPDRLRDPASSPTNAGQFAGSRTGDMSYFVYSSSSGSGIALQGGEKRGGLSSTFPVI